jgi:hypothetical protein
VLKILQYIGVNKGELQEKNSVKDVKKPKPIADALFSQIEYP